AAIGHWVPPSATYAIDPVIYNATGDTTPIPAWIAPLALADTQASMGEITPYCKNFSLTLSEGKESPQIFIKFYYGPWTSKGTANFGGFVTRPFADDLQVIVYKAASGVLKPPTCAQNYSGLAQVEAKSRVFSTITIWLNVYPYVDFRQQIEAHPELNLDWRAIARTTQGSIAWHELFHAVGLNDDPVGTTPGLMVYKSRLARPNPNELDVSKWLYKEQ
ncbi:MAG: hypothetical protein WC381_11425, partial [Kiritimatiellia bacterium]